MRSFSLWLTKKPAVRFLSVFAAVLLTLVLLLWASTRLPQERIDGNIQRSLERLEFEGTYTYVLDGRPSSMLDNYTDTIILTVCKSSGPQERQSFLTNPFFGSTDVIGSLAGYCAGEQAPESYYVRYWLGFRIFLRPLLEFFDFQHIRYVTIAAFFLVLALAVWSVCRSVSRLSGLAFLVSIVLIRPYICSRCLQYLCCPLIALAAVLFVPWVEKRRSGEALFFMVIGMLTMFFDFYTVPILTFGLPMVCMLAVRAKRGEPLSWRFLLRCFAAWGAGYALTWLVKLALVELFTEYKGFANGFSEFRMWLRRDPGTAFSAAPYGKALAALKRAILPDTASAAVMALLAAATVAGTVWQVKRGKGGRLRETAPILAVGLLPLLWFAAALKPITVHAFFQYRSIAVLYWAVGAWVTLPGVRETKNV